MADILSKQTTVVAVAGDPPTFDRLVQDWAEGRAYGSRHYTPEERELSARNIRDAMHQRDLDAASQPPVVQVTYATGPQPAVRPTFVDDQPTTVYTVTRSVHDALTGPGPSIAEDYLPADAVFEPPPEAAEVIDVEVG